MRKQGLLTNAELEDVRKAALADHLGTMSEDDKYHPAHIDRMRADAGPGDGEDEDAVTARRADAVTKVAAHLHGHAVLSGHLTPKEAVRTLAHYVDLPANSDPERVIADVMDAVHTGRRLPRAGRNPQDDAALLQDALSRRPAA
jgi:hypothetical protein